MTKIKITGLEKELDRTKLRIGSAIKKSKFAKDLRDDIINEVRDKGLSQPLSDGWVRKRGELAKINKTDPAYSKGKSNLTFSGQLLNGLRGIFVTSTLSFIIGYTESKENKLHKIYKNSRKDKRKASDFDSSSSKVITLGKLFGEMNKKRPILQVFDRREFKLEIERKLVSAIKRFFK